MDGIVKLVDSKAVYRHMEGIDEELSADCKCEGTIIMKDVHSTSMNKVVEWMESKKDYPRRKLEDISPYDYLAEGFPVNLEYLGTQVSEFNILLEAAINLRISELAYILKQYSLSLY